ncbi:PAS domain S-box-containing protein [Desulfacinum hydrothermale DSM 13146]|uniref:histidine kinase n=1 Tax=Desulfacinum hydrothermale DSM 13146 TaxID=1121390 RepID=A0A1W1XMU4_9BACT|nr:ATP-binding protein [Desulfacinum hydrothermale]SMC25273.1 PAS domain S-box-containing protein [Desulfacinum hydrothermale DSM 13146]
MALSSGIFRKFLLAFLALSLVPLCVLGFFTIERIRQVGTRAVESTTRELERKSKEAIEVRAVELARRVSVFLKACEADLRTLQMLPRDAQVYQDFSRTHRGEIWTREGTNEDHTEVRRRIPLYKEVAFIGPDGRERIRVVDDRIVGEGELRDVSVPRNTTYKSETYFQETRRLPADQIHVSHVTGWYVSREEQLGRASSVEEAVEGAKYEGVVRFALPCRDDDGSFQGMVMLSLDHRHLMEMTQHILPTEERFVVFPSYSSGNYAFMFDDEGWIISHANYPFIARQVRQGRSGVTRTFNVGGNPRVMAYAPILYDTGPYKKYGIFGGITIGVQTAKFAEPAIWIERQIVGLVRRTRANFLLLVGLSMVGAVLAAYVLARAITGPLRFLTAQAQKVAAGEGSWDLRIRTGDEVEILAREFHRMTVEAQAHRRRLEQSLAELEASKQSLEAHSEELQRQLHVFKNLHYLSHYLGVVFDREMLLGAVLKTCVDGLGFDRSILYLYQAETHQLVCHATFGFAPAEEARAKAARYDVRHHDCVPTRVFRHGEAIFVHDIHKDRGASALDLKISRVSGVRVFAFVPIKVRDQVIGVLGADNASSGRPLEKIQVDSLQILANDAARAIERSMLYGQIAQERNFVQFIFRHFTMGIITVDAAGCLSSINPQAENLLALPRGVRLHRPWKDVFAPLPGWKEAVEAFWSGDDQEGTVELSVAGEDGRERFVEAHLARIDAENPDVRLLIVLRDVSSRKKMEEHLRRSDRLISLGTLSAGIAHEIRNPLTGVCLMLDDLHDHLMGRPQEQAIITRAMQEMERLENLIHSLLDFASPASTDRRKATSLDQEVQRTLFLVNKQCRTRQIHVAVEVDPKSVPVALDPDRFRQALLNIVLNGIDAMEAGGRLSIQVLPVEEAQSLLDGPAMRVCVRDTGTGIAREDLPYVFDPFFSRKAGGVGLGLSIVHSIVEESGGRVHVESEPGSGTTFIMDFPLYQEVPAAQAEGEGDGTDLGRGR